MVVTRRPRRHRWCVYPRCRLPWDRQPAYTTTGEASSSMDIHGEQGMARGRHLLTGPHPQEVGSRGHFRRRRSPWCHATTWIRPMDGGSPTDRGSAHPPRPGRQRAPADPPPSMLGDTSQMLVRRLIADFDVASGRAALDTMRSVGHANHYRARSPRIGCISTEAGGPRDEEASSAVGTARAPRRSSSLNRHPGPFLDRALVQRSRVTVPAIPLTVSTGEREGPTGFGDPIRRDSGGIWRSGPDLRPY